MNPNRLAFICLVLAAIPAALFALNLLFYRSPRNRPATRKERISVLIPARNEEQNIRATLQTVLANRDCDFEVIVLDDSSTDRTAAIVGEVATLDPRLRLELAPPLPAGWCGKPHACHRLAQLARYELLVFMDADVRLKPDALARLAGFMMDSKTALASGIPRQELGTFSEQLLLPLIHFVLLGYLPMPVMHWTKLASFSAGCGQLFIARRNAYGRCGGHAQLRDSLHDGLKLPRVFRRAGFRTDLFDATGIATCRMYRTNGDTWRGLGKNAVEGLAAPGTIGPMTALLFGGQVLPFLLLPGIPMLSPVGTSMVVTAVALAALPRLVSIVRFRQPFVSALLHPLGILALLYIQWHAFIRHLWHKPTTWKGRLYHTPKPVEPIQTT